MSFVTLITLVHRGLWQFCTIWTRDESALWILSGRRSLWPWMFKSKHQALFSSWQWGHEATQLEAVPSWGLTYLVRFCRRISIIQRINISYVLASNM